MRVYTKSLACVFVSVCVCVLPLSLLSLSVFLFFNPTRFTQSADPGLLDPSWGGKAQAESVQSVCPVGKNHPYWMKTVDPETGKLGMLHDNQVYRRQELPPVYMLDGGVIALTRSSLFSLVEGQPHAFLGADRRAVVTEPGDVVDIDTKEDLKAAEALLEERLRNGTIRAVG